MLGTVFVLAVAAALAYVFRDELVAAYKRMRDGK